MARSSPNKQAIVDAIRQVAEKLGRPPSRAEFIAKTGITEYHVLKHFASWREAVRSAGLQPHMSNVKLEEKSLFGEWG